MSPGTDKLYSRLHVIDTHCRSRVYPRCESLIFHTRLLTVWETEAAPASPRRMASTEVMCLVNRVKFRDISLREVDDFAIA